MARERTERDFDDISDDVLGDQHLGWRKPPSDSRIRIDRSWLTAENAAIATRKRGLDAAIDADETLRHTIDLVINQVGYDHTLLQNGVEDPVEDRNERWERVVYSTIPQERRDAVAGINQTMVEGVGISFAIQRISGIPAGEAFTEDNFPQGFIRDPLAAFLLTCMANERALTMDSDAHDTAQYADAVVQDLGLGTNRSDQSLRDVSIWHVVAATLIPPASSGK